MNRAVKNLVRAVGVVAGLAGAAWALRDRMLPAPEIHTEPPPKFRTDGGDDDLTLIKGIGPVYRERLASSGIHIFADLASRTAEEIADITGTNLAAAENWVSTAQQMG